MAEAVRPPAAATADPSPHTDPRAHELRARYLRLFRRRRDPGAGGVDRRGPPRPAHRGVGRPRLLGHPPPGRASHRPERGGGDHDDIPIRRHRFTIAHELGHWVCHVLGAPSGSEPAPSFCRAVDLPQDADRAIEREANVFAAELLMPEPALRAAWDATPEIDAVAARFGVSRLAAHWRLYGFGLVGEMPA